MYSQAAGCYQASGDVALTARLTFFLAGVPWATGDIDRAEPIYREALRLNRETEGDPWSYPFARYLAASITSSRGDYESAQSTLDEINGIFRQLEHPIGLGHTHIGLASLALDQGNYAEAVSQYEKSIPFEVMLGDHSMLAVANSRLAAIAWLQNDDEQAMKLQYQGLAEFNETGSLPGMSWAMGNIRYSMRTLGDVDWMLLLQAQRQGTSSESAAKSAIAETLYTLGRIADIQGDHDRASVILRQCLTLYSEIGQSRGVELAILEAANLAAAQGNPSRGGRLLAAAKSAATITAPLLVEYERLEYERVEAVLEAAAGGGTISRSTTAGAGMTIAEAISFALTGLD